VKIKRRRREGEEERGEVTKKGSKSENILEKDKKAHQKAKNVKTGEEEQEERRSRGRR